MNQGRERSKKVQEILDRYKTYKQYIPNQFEMNLTPSYSENVKGYTEYKGVEQTVEGNLQEERKIKEYRLYIKKVDNTLKTIKDCYKDVLISKYINENTAVQGQVLLHMEESTYFDNLRRAKISFLHIWDIWNEYTKEI